MLIFLILQKTVSKMEIKIDPYSGFCSGVIRAIKLVEKDLAESEQLYCLGEIVHNGAEVNRLSDKGLKMIDYAEFKKLRNAKVFLRAHGEPPSTYALAKKNNISLIDASCKIVLSLQKKIEKAYAELIEINGQLLISGKKKHPEIIGLNGFAGSKAIVIERKSDLEKVDFELPIRLFSQTTNSVNDFRELVKEITNRMPRDADFKFEESICKQVSGRETSMAFFAEDNELIIFVGGKNSSNARFLYNICKPINDKSYFISDKLELKKRWFKGVKSIGISGATSTPRWQMEEVKSRIEELLCI